ncbi:MAG: addiction module protein [Verrucomicrobiae bacterium]|nr:addiction module protein [Verrucomicrobiae bacterium]
MNLTVEEKVELAQQLWSEVAGEVEEKRNIPEWHHQVIQDRLAGLKSGKSRPISFEQAKRELDAKIAEHRNAR